jgi:hypothetical protein
MAFELWDTSSGNMIRSYATVDEALGLVRTTISARGRRAVSRWALVSIGDDGTLATVAQGAELAARATHPIPA